MLHRTTTKIGWIIAVLMFLCCGAYADMLEVAGSTTGSFNGNGSTLDELTFGSGTFDNGGSSATLNLGSFSLGPTCLKCGTNYTGDNFDLSVKFTAPTGASPNPLPATANLIGAAWWQLGFVYINFNNAPIHVTSSQGSFDLTVKDATVLVGQTVTLNGTISNVTTGTTTTVAAADSEPLFATALLCGGVLFFFRKRLRSC